MNTIPSYSTHTNAEPPVTEGHGESLTSNRLPNCAYGEFFRHIERHPAFAPKIILIPLTLSNGSYPTLAIARNLAEQSNAKLVLLHVVQLNIAGEEYGIPRTRLFHDLCRNAETQLQELAGCMGGQTVVEILVREGRPAEAIIETARRLEADTIIMRQHGHRQWLKWLHRNTALNVARQAPCKVWLVSQGKQAETINLLMMDHTSIPRLPKQEAPLERQNPFRPPLRIPFF